MKADIKAQWLKDLRSGEYKQTTNRLSDGENFCCLGVLCEQAVKAGVIEKSESKSHYSTTIRYGGSDSVLPDEVVEWAELDSTDPRVTFEYTYDGDDEPAELKDALSGANDDYGKTFKQIADLIEEQL